MAQAARLNLRMQKELKLLVTDPPPGASFPLLSPDSDISSFSLSTIDAHIEGPEGTVYSKGIFHIKIQIPERYPFQPPSVTFATPIYHPNIDNGGRICLDILNLPPKGAWQPSLNISTVLTSIGLLLSDPNPDDGLMCEVSREYKYNRQAFDQKARSMTEKYAKAGASGCSSSSQSILPNSNPTMREIKGPDKESNYEVNDHIVSHKKQIIRKLSLESDREYNETPNHHYMEIQVPKKEHEHEKLSGTRRKLSLNSLEPIPSSHMEIQEPKKECEKLSGTKCKLSLNSLVSSSVVQTSNRCERPHQDAINTSSKKLCSDGQKFSLQSSNSIQVNDANSGKILTTPQQPSSSVPRGVNGSYFKPSSSGKKLSLGFNSLSKRQEMYKENVMPACDILTTPSKCLIRKDHDEKNAGGVERERVEESPIPDAVIVLDSEDSEDEGSGCLRSRLSLARRRLVGKTRVEA